MPINLTGTQISDTYDQLLHVSDGPTSTAKVVYSGAGTATALKVATTHVEVDSIRLDGTTVSTTTTNGNLNLAPNGTGAVVIGMAQITGGTITSITDLAIADGGTGASTAADARTNLGLGTMATQAASAVAITGGTVSGVTFTGSFSGLTLVESTTLATGNAAAGCNLNGATLAADGTDSNIDINITPKGTGEVNITNIDVVSGKVPFNTITGLAYASFYDADTADQTGSTTAATAVEFATVAVTGAGITVASNTRITFAAAGTYRVNASLQLNNSSATDRFVDIWFSKNGTNIANSNGRVSIPKIGDGGTYLLAYEIFETVTAGQYIEIYWYPENVAVTLHYRAAVAASPGVTPAIPATPPAIVVAQRIA